MSTFSRISHRGAFGGLLLVLLWLPLAWVQLGPFRLPSTDSWTYFAGVALARWPLDLHLPMVGAWNAGDTTWAIHWPGAYLLYSFVTPWLPAGGWVHTGLMLLSWLALALATAALTWTLTKNEAWALGALALVLVDRALFESLLDMRGECLSALVIVVTLLGWHRVLGSAPGEPAPRTGAIGLIGGSFLLPLMHPLSVPLVTLLALSLVGGWARRPDRRGPAALALAASVLGTLALVSWYHFHPNGWGQLFEHASLNRRPYSFGGTFLSTLAFYAPIYLPVLLVLVALAESVRRFWLHLNAKTLFPALTGGDLGLLAGGLLAVSLVAQQNFHNFFYYLVTLPLVIALSLSGGAFLFARLPRARRGLAVVLLLGLLLLQGLFLPMRTMLWWQAGRPDFDRIIGTFLDALPMGEQSRLVLPGRLWAESLRRWPEDRLRVTLPEYGAAWENRSHYLNELVAQTRAGDVVVVGRYFNRPWQDKLVDPTQAELVREWEYVTPGTKDHGLRFRVYRVLSPSVERAASPPSWER